MKQWLLIYSEMIWDAIFFSVLFVLLLPAIIFTAASWIIAIAVMGVVAVVLFAIQIVGELGKAVVQR